jgi:hypothetical protein
VIPLFLAAADGSPWWWAAIRDVAIPVLGAGAIIYWFATRLEKKLDEILAALRDNTKATVDYTAASREHTSALVALKGQVAEVERDVERVEVTLRENTGKHIVPLELRKKEGG